MLPTSLDELSAFVAVAQAGGFTPAGRRLRLTTNAVSLRIQKLEQTLGVKLFVRTTRRVALTNEGTRFLASVSKVLVDLETAQDDLRSDEELVRGTVRIAIPGAVATTPFFDRLRDLFAAHPALSVELRVTNQRVDLAAEGLDIALAVGQQPASTFVGRLLGKATWVLAASPGYLKRHGRPKTPGDLAQHQCLRLLAHPAQDEWALIDDKGREHVVPVTGGLVADDSRALGDATYAGLGIGVRPLAECARADKQGTLKRVLPTFRFRSLEVYALLPKGRARTPRVALCLEALRAAIVDLA